MQSSGCRGIDMIAQERIALAERTPDLPLVIDVPAHEQDDFLSEAAK